MAVFSSFYGGNGRKSLKFSGFGTFFLASGSQMLNSRNRFYLHM
jgi:hypothetical protein